MQSVSSDAIKSYLIFQNGTAHKRNFEIFEPQIGSYSSGIHHICIKMHVFFF